MRILKEVLFWSHLIFILIAISTGVIFSLQTVIILVLLHRFHTLIFKGCAFSKVQRITGGLPKNIDFLQYSIKRLFGTDIDRKQSKILDYSFAFLTIFIASLRVFI